MIGKNMVDCRKTELEHAIDVPFRLRQIPVLQPVNPGVLAKGRSERAQGAGRASTALYVKTIPSITE